MDGRPSVIINHRNNAVFSNLSGVEWKGRDNKQNYF